MPGFILHINLMINFNESIVIRPIAVADNMAIAKIIRSSLEEFGANHPGTVYYDDTTDHLYTLFQQTGSAYWVAEQDGIILGGAGIYPTPGLPEATCELVKMYLKPTARSQGLGGYLIGLCLKEAAALGYKQVYLESMPELAKAVSVYEHFGFTKINGPLGHSGHFGCAIQMLKQL